jgi:hypothetical protein
MSAKNKLKSKLTAALTDLREIDQDLRTQHAAAVISRKRIKGAIEPRAELKKTLVSAVDTVGARWRGEHALITAQALSTHNSKGALPTYAHQPLTLAALAGLAPEIVKASLSRMVDEAQFEEGLPASARADALELIDGEIGTILEEHTSLVTMASAMGVSIQELPEAAQARRDAAKQAELEELRLASEARQAELGPNPLMIGQQEVMRTDGFPTRH